MREESTYNRTLTLAALAAGALSTMLGLVVLVGWYTHNETLIQVQPAFAPMQYNAALGFLLSGIGLFSTVFGKKRLAMALGGIIAALGILTLIQYAFGVNLGIDQFFMEHYISVETSTPGRMAPNTALSFGLTGTALLSLGAFPRLRKRPLILGLLGSMIFALGAVAFYGYLSGVDTAYGWGHLTRMAVHTAFGFALLGVGFLALAWREGKKGNAVPRWIPIFVFVAGATASLLVWQALVAQDRTVMSLRVDLEAGRTAATIEDQMKERILALMHVAGNWEVRGGTPQKEWESDVATHIEYQPGYQAIEWVDPSFHVRWIVPVEGNETALDLDLAFEDRRRIALEEVRDRREATVTRPIDLVQGGKGFLIYVPIFIEENFDGFILGVYQNQALFEAILGEDVANGYSIIIYDGDEEIYTRGDVSSGQRKEEWASETDITFPGVTWRMLIWPEPELLVSQRSTLSTIVLIAGLLVTLLFALSIYQSQIAHSRAERIAWAQQRVTEAHDFNQAILETAPVGIITYDAISGQCISTNMAAGDIIGATQVQVLQQNFRQISSWQKSGMIAAAENALETGTSQNLEVNITTTFSKEIWIGCFFTPFAIENDPRLLLIFSDITDRIKLEIELREHRDRLEELVQERTTQLSEANLSLQAANAQQKRVEKQLVLANRRLVDAERIAHMGSWEDDIATGESSWSDEFFQICGLEPGSLQPTTEARMQLIHPDDRQAAREAVQNAIEGGTSYAWEERIVRPGGEVRIVLAQAEVLHDEKGQPVRMVGAFLDITERKQAEDEIRRYQAIVQTASDAVVTVDENHNVVLFNPAAEALFGVSTQEAIGAPLSRFLPGRFQDAHGHHLRRFAEMGETTRSMGQRTELIAVKANGDEFPIEANISRVNVSGGRYFTAILRDITERKRAESQIQNYAVSLASSNVELQQFAYVASHDLQEPLRVVTNYLQLLERRYQGQLDEEAEKFISRAVEASTRMKRLINDLLAYSRVTSRGDQFKSIVLAEVLDEVLENLAIAIEENSATITHDPLPEITADVGQMAQLLQNLIGNAIKFHGQQPPEIHIGAQRENGAWHFSVRDNGIGIESEYNERIFGIFQRLHTRREYEGTGIGLAVCKKIVERHGGRIWMESQSGKGTTFHFTIRVGEEHQAYTGIQLQ